MKFLLAILNGSVIRRAPCIYQLHGEVQNYCLMIVYLPVYTFHISIQFTTHEGTAVGQCLSYESVTCNMIGRQKCLTCFCIGLQTSSRLLAHIK